MEPRQSGYDAGAERQPIQVGYGEAGPRLSPEQPLPNPERVVERTAPQETPAPPPILPTLPAPIPDDTTPQPAVTVDDTSLMLAADDDLIEKEWVEKAKRIIASTKDDPYRREQEVGKLQIEYIRKRYGREIGETTTQ